MNTKDLTTLAFVVVIVLAGALIMAVAPKGKVARLPSQNVGAGQPGGPGTTGAESVKSTVEVVSDNVKTNVKVK